MLSFERRVIVTHVAIFSSIPEVQGCLPQIFLGVRPRFPQRLYEIVAEERSNCKFWREAIGENS
jgi:hypothetical protein